MSGIKKPTNPVEVLETYIISPHVDTSTLFQHWKNRKLYDIIGEEKNSSNNWGVIEKAYYHSSSRFTRLNGNNLNFRMGVFESRDEAQKLYDFTFSEDFFTSKPYEEPKEKPEKGSVTLIELLMYRNPISSTIKDLQKQVELATKDQEGLFQYIYSHYSEGNNWACDDYVSSLQANSKNGKQAVKDLDVIFRFMITDIYRQGLRRNKSFFETDEWSKDSDAWSDTKYLLSKVVKKKRFKEDKV